MSTVGFIGTPNNFLIILKLNHKTTSKSILMYPIGPQFKLHIVVPQSSENCRDYD
jgi:hypothetical protein